MSVLPNLRLLGPSKAIGFSMHGDAPLRSLWSFVQILFLSAGMQLLAQTPHPGGMLVALADGSVRSLAPHLSGATWWAACTPNGGETLGQDWVN
jgi:hypothetical protein